MDKTGVLSEVHPWTRDEVAILDKKKREYRPGG